MKRGVCGIQVDFDVRLAPRVEVPVSCNCTAMVPQIRHPMLMVPATGAYMLQRARERSTECSEWGRSEWSWIDIRDSGSPLSVMGYNRGMRTPKCGVFPSDVLAYRDEILRTEVTEVSVTGFSNHPSAGRHKIGCAESAMGLPVVVVVSLETQL